MVKRGAVLAALVILALLGLVLARKRPGRPALPTVTIEVPQNAGVFRLPFQIGERLGFFRQAGIAVRLVREKAALRLSPVGSSWPILGVVGSRPDAFVISPVDDPGFRLAWLSGVPVAYPAGQEMLTVWAKAVWTMHNVEPAALDPLSASEIGQLWAMGHLPYLLTDVETWLGLNPPPAAVRPAAALGASTGPIFTWVITGRAPEAPRVLAALNMALWYLANHSPKAAAEVVRAPRLRRLLAITDRYHLLAPSTYPILLDYERARKLARLVGDAWPPYDRAVDTAPAIQALALTP
jgi:hypothetical protein